MPENFTAADHPQPDAESTKKRQTLTATEAAELLPFIFPKNSKFGPEQVANLVGLDADHVNMHGAQKAISCVFTPDNRVMGGKMWDGAAVAAWLQRAGLPLSIRGDVIARAKAMARAKTDKAEADKRGAAAEEQARAEIQQSYRELSTRCPAMVDVVTLLTMMEKHKHTAADVLQMLQ